MGGHIDRKTIGIEGVSEWKEKNTLDMCRISTKKISSVKYENTKH